MRVCTVLCFRCTCRINKKLPSRTGKKSGDFKKNVKGILNMLENRLDRLTNRCQNVTTIEELDEAMKEFNVHYSEYVDEDYVRNVGFVQIFDENDEFLFNLCIGMRDWYCNNEGDDASSRLRIKVIDIDENLSDFGIAVTSTGDINRNLGRGLTATDINDIMTHCGYYDEDYSFENDEIGDRTDIEYTLEMPASCIDNVYKMSLSVVVTDIDENGERLVDVVDVNAA